MSELLSVVMITLLVYIHYEVRSCFFEKQTSKNKSILCMYNAFVEHSKIEPLKQKWYTKVNLRDLLQTSHLHNIFVFFALSNFKYRGKDSFFEFLLLLLHDFSLNSGPTDMDYPSSNNDCDVSWSRGLYLVDINSSLSEK